MFIDVGFSILEIPKVDLIYENHPYDGAKEIVEITKIPHIISSLTEIGMKFNRDLGLFFIIIMRY